MAAVVDANPLIGLAKGGALHLLHEVFGEVIVPPSVWKEVVEDGAGRPGAAETEAAQHAGWLHVEAAPPPPPGLAVPARLTQADLDVVLLAQARGAHLVTDDRPARAFAEVLGLSPEFTVDVILAGKLLGIVPSCKDVLDRMATEGFGIEHGLAAAILQAAGEDS